MVYEWDGYYLRAKSEFYFILATMTGKYFSKGVLVKHALSRCKKNPKPSLPYNITMTWRLPLLYVIVVNSSWTVTQLCFMGSPVNRVTEASQRKRIQLLPSAIWLLRIIENWKPLLFPSKRSTYRLTNTHLVVIVWETPQNLYDVKSSNYDRFDDPTLKLSDVLFLVSY